MFNNRNSSTQTIYKKSVCDSLILNERNVFLWKLVVKKDSLLAVIDSTLELSKSIHRKYSLSYSRTIYEIERFQSTLKYNIDQIESYLTRGEVIASIDFDANKVTFTSDMRVPFIVNWGDQSVIINTYELKLSHSDDIVKKIREKSLEINNRNIKDINLINYITRDTIKTFTYNYF